MELLNLVIETGQTFSDVVNASSINRKDGLIIDLLDKGQARS